MVMRSEVGSSSTYRERPKLGSLGREDHSPKAVLKRYRPEPFAYAKIVKSKIQDGNVDLLARLKIVGDEQLFNVNFPETLLAAYKAGARIKVKDLAKVKVRFEDQDRLKTLKTVTGRKNGDSLADTNFKTIVRFAVENVVDEYRAENSLKSLHRAPKRK